MTVRISCNASRSGHLGDVLLLAASAPGGDMPVRDSWPPEEWQEHCIGLLVMKYGTNVQPVPDRVRGDGGMEAYRLDDRVVYQCYAPQDAFTAGLQTAAQKKKIYDDTSKLTDDPARTRALLGPGYKVRRWVLLTPEYDDKDLISYARQRSETLRTALPAWCCPTLEIVVFNDREYFTAELAKLYGTTASIYLNVPEPDEGEALESVGADVAEKVRAKLRTDSSLAARPDNLEAYLHETLMDFVYGSRQIDALESQFTVTSTAVHRTARQVFKTLQRLMIANDGGPSGVQALTDRFSSRLQEIPGLPSSTCDELARFFVAKWWVDCPLNFRVSAS